MIVLSGGQTGVDLAALFAAWVSGLRTGGMMPPGYMTEAGPAPLFRDLFGLEALDAEDFRDPKTGRIDWTTAYRVRTVANVQQADAIVLLTTDVGWSSPGSKLVRKTAGQDKAIFDRCIAIGRSREAEAANRESSECLVGFLRVFRDKRILFCGNREKSAPGIFAAASRILLRVFDEVAR